MRTIVPKVFCVGLFLAASFASSVFSLAHGAAAEKTDKQKGSVTDKMVKSESPIHITSDRMEAKQQENTVVFEGHVVVQQDDMTLTSNRLTVVALPTGKGNPEDLAEKIDYIQADGDIKVTQQDKLATSDKAIFYQKDQKIVLFGHPVVTKGKDKIEGSLITIFLQQGRSIVEGGKDVPVKAILFPGKKE